MHYPENAPAFRLISLKKAAPLIATALFMMGAAPAAQALHGRSRSAPPVETVTGTSLLGSYLAGHVARATRDSEAAALYYRRALAKDPANEDILDEAFQLELASGNYDGAKALAQRLAKKQPENAIAHIFLGADAYRHEDYSGAEEHFKAAQRAATADDPTIKLSRAWTAVAQGHAKKGIASMQSAVKTDWAVHFESVQRAFMADVARDKEAAQEAYGAIYDKAAPNLRIAEAYARHLAVWGEREKALSVLQESGAHETPMGKVLLAELQAGKKPRLMVSNAAEGLGESFLGIGQVLSANNGVDAAQIYFRIALMLNPQSDIGKLELAELYGNIEHYGKAIAVIDKIQENSPFWVNSQMRKGLYLNSMQKAEEASKLMAAMLEKRPENLQLLQTAAAIESSRKNYAAAIPYYDRAIKLIGPPQKKDWQLFYSRGVAFERTKQWEKAEPDFKKSLELDPEQGATLNYLGYSWLDQNLHIPEAFDLIKKAVKLHPNDGYIIDSLGWAFFLQKDYEQAVKQLDKAVELRPEDPTLNDHLGDVYWRLGRKLEAKFQWTQALSLNPEPEDAAKIKKKLEGGLQDEAGPRAELLEKAAPAAAEPAPVPAPAPAPEPQPAPAPAPRSEAAPAVQPAAASAPQPEAAPAVQPAAAAAPQPAAAPSAPPSGAPAPQTEAAPAVQPVAAPGPQPEAAPAVQPAAVSAPQSEAAPAVPPAEAPAPQPETKTQ
jgi:tetratricopeptide (TPR) repeat protein